MPRASRARTENVWEPSFDRLRTSGLVQEEKVAESREHSKVAVVSVEEKANVGEV